MSRLYGPQNVFHQVRSPQDYEQLHLRALDNARRRLLKPDLRHYVSPVRQAVYINHGRIVVLCQCQAAVSVSREWNIGRCLECGAIHNDPIWPDNFDEVESALIVRPYPFRNWRPGETVEQLLLDNVTFGVIDVR